MIDFDTPAIYRRRNASTMIARYVQLYTRSLCEGKPVVMRYAWRMLIAWQEIGRRAQ